MYYVTNPRGFSVDAESRGIVFGGEFGISGGVVRIDEIKVESFCSKAFHSESFMLDPLTGKMSPIRRAEDGRKIDNQGMLPQR